MRTPLLVLTALWAGAGSAVAGAPQPFVATYAVSYRGIDAGTLRMELRHDPQSGRYVYETRAEPTTLARLVVSRDAVERTQMEITPEGVRPVQWHLDDGKSGDKGDGSLQFDWTAGRVTGWSEGKQVALETKPGLQDRLSMQISVMNDLLNGHEPGAVAIVNDDHLREYTYTRGASTSVDTRMGKIDAVLYESTRPNSNRVSRVWHAPSMQYLPVRAEQVRKGKVETVMTLIAVDRQ